MGRSEIARGWDLFQLGAFTEAESIALPLAKTPAAQHLLLWIALRRGDTNAKLRYGALLAEAADPDLASVGRAHENVALVTDGAAPKPWLIARKRWSQAEVAYARALMAFMAGDDIALRSELAKAAPQSAEQRVRYAQLRAWAKALHDDFESQATLLSNALTRALRERVDRSLVAIIAGSLALLLREIDLGEAATHVDSLLTAVFWPTDASIYEFYAQRATAWRKSTHGDWITAMQLLDDALAVAPDAMRRGLIFADRARISTALGEHVASSSSVKFAFECFESVDWNIAKNDEIIGLMSSADVLCSDMQRSRKLIDLAASIPVSKMIGAGHGKRLEAFKHFALSHFDADEDAFAHAQHAYRLFKSMKFVHRAMDAALRAVELGGGSRWRERVDRLASQYPRSLAARRYERNRAPILRIKGRRREVLDLLVSSPKTAREIGLALGMAENTVRVHIKHINRILNVESRAALIQLALRGAA